MALFINRALCQLIFDWLAYNNTHNAVKIDTVVCVKQSDDCSNDIRCDIGRWSVALNYKWAFADHKLRLGVLNSRGSFLFCYTNRIFSANTFAQCLYTNISMLKWCWINVAFHLFLKYNLWCVYICVLCWNFSFIDWDKEISTWYICWRLK